MREATVFNEGCNENGHRHDKQNRFARQHQHNPTADEKGEQQKRQNRERKIHEVDFNVVQQFCKLQVSGFSASDDKLQFLPMRNEAAFIRLTEEAADGFPALLAVIKRPMVHIHPDELVGEIAPHVAGVL